MGDFQKRLVVAAIDFGTSYSGYAYSFRSDPEKIYTNAPWDADGSNMLTLKAPTVVLFDKEGTFDSFGFEAESKYAELAEDDMHVGWRYFKHFKMKLGADRKFRRTFKLTDDQGKTMPAKFVFGAAISYFKKHMVNRLQDNIVGITELDINWVLTIPAIWNDGAKQFMMEAAKEAEIPQGHLILALEPEVAAVYCKTASVSTARTADDGAAVLKSFDPGAQFMVLDLGGGTVDITVHEVLSDGRLRELLPPSGGPWGGTVVDRAFKHIFYDIFGKDTFDKLKEKSKMDQLHLFRTFELRKRTVKKNFKENDKVTITIPFALINAFGNEQKFAAAIEESSYAATIEKKFDKLRIKVSQVADMFQGPKDLIVSHVRRLLEKEELSKVETLLMVGGFSESEFMKSSVKEAFPKHTIISPSEAGLAVLKGAVVYGHNIDTISSRKISHTYGVSTKVPFDPEIHPMSHKHTNHDGTLVCEDVFTTVIEAGSTVVPEKTSKTVTFNGSSSCSVIELYKTPQEKPKYVTDDGCQKVGEIYLDINSSERVPVVVTMYFGSIELEVKAKVEGTSEPIITHFDFLN